jgi:hypothetical protein
LIDNDQQRSTTIAVEGMIFAFGFSKKYDLSLLLIVGWVLDRFRAFERLASVNAHLWSGSDLYIPSIELPILLQKNMWTNPGNI